MMNVNTGQKQRSMITDVRKVQLKELFTLETGVSVNSTDQHYDNLAYVLKTSALNFPFLNLNEVKIVAPDDLHRVKTYVKKESILISRMNTPQLVGATTYSKGDKTNIFLPDRIWQTVFHSKNVLPRWLAYYFEANSVSKKIKELGTGTSGSMKNISKVDFLNFIVLLPPLPEQSRIVAILEFWDKAIELLGQKIKFKKQVKKGLMQQLLNGKKRLPGFDGGWQEVKFGDLCEFQNGFAFKSKKFSENSGVRIIRNRDLKGDNSLLFYNAEDFDDDYLVKDGDVLVGMDGDFMTCRWVGGKSLLNQRVGRLRKFKNADSGFIFYFAKKVLKQIEQETSSTTVKHLSSRTFIERVVVVPYVKEQTAIASVLTAADDEIEALEQKKQLLEDQKTFLLNHLVTGKIRTPENMSVQLT